MLGRMTWQFLTFDRGPAFLASDNPVFYFRCLGIANIESEVSFPISSNVALWATWRGDFEDGYVSTRESWVRGLNRRTASSATRYLFHPISEDWILPLLLKSSWRINVLGRAASVTHGETRPPGRRLLRREHQPRDQRRRLLLHCRDGVRVGVQRDRDRGMAEVGQTPTTGLSRACAAPISNTMADGSRVGRWPAPVTITRSRGSQRVLARASRMFRVVAESIG
jgi:hypothetical protein